MTDVHLRATQERILEYTHGKMGISAVPGSGKTWTLSHLAAKLILNANLADDQEILVVTFSTSAADNFASRIGGLVRQQGLMAGMGYRVRTLHGLANDIIHERPDLANLGNAFSIIDEAESTEILSDLASGWLSANPDFFASLLSDDLSERKYKEVTSKDIPILVQNLASNFIKTAKDLRLSPEELRQHMERLQEHVPLLDFGCEMYKQYQAALNYRGGVDFDDLIHLAYKCLESDPDLVARLRYRWPYILEDEAQDSSELQEAILRLLLGPDGNWVRVGDPNQAIYASFTTANPNLLKRYLRQADVLSRDLPESGRSAPAIIRLANALNTYTQNRHPNPNARDALSLPLIQPTRPGDPQPNPRDRLDTVEIVERRMSSEQEVTFIAAEAKQWLQAEPGSTVAVLTLTNKHLGNLSKGLENIGVPIVQALMNVPESARKSAGSIFFVLRCVARPDSPAALAKSYEVWNRSHQENTELWKEIEQAADLLRACKATEDFVYPFEERDWLASLEAEDTPQSIIARLTDFRTVLRRWHEARVLSADQLVLSIAYDLDLDPVELAIVHKLSILVKELQQNHPDWTLADLSAELEGIARNERRFFNFSEKEDGFDPEQYPGKVVVATMHKAKGLEWDKVFIASANNYDYPSGQPDDNYFSERWYLKNELNLSAEILAQLYELLEGRTPSDFREGRFGLIDRDAIIRDRLRLLYVGITRARKSLTISWNTGQLNNSTESLPVSELRKLLAEEGHE